MMKSQLILTTVVHAYTHAHDVTWGAIFCLTQMFTMLLDLPINENVNRSMGVSSEKPGQQSKVERQRSKQKAFVKYWIKSFWERVTLWSNPK